MNFGRTKMEILLGIIVFVLSILVLILAINLSEDKRYAINLIAFAYGLGKSEDDSITLILRNSNSLRNSDKVLQIMKDNIDAAKETKTTIKRQR